MQSVIKIDKYIEVFLNSIYCFPFGLSIMTYVIRTVISWLFRLLHVAPDIFWLYGSW